MADFDGYGRIDIATADIGGLASVLLGKGDGTFRSGSRLTAGGGPSDIIAVDLDGDGQADISVIDAESSHRGGNCGKPRPALC